MPSFIIEILACAIAANSACFIAEKLIYKRPLTKSERLLIISQIKIDKRK